MARIMTIASRPGTGVYAVFIAFIAAALCSGGLERSSAAGLARTASGRPDLSGVWMRPYVPDMTRNGRNQKGYADLPFTSAGLEDWKTYDAANGDYTGSCMPFGLTRSFNSPEP